MSNSIVAAIYRYVIDDVVRNVQPDFEGHGVDNSVLEQLQRSWEAKIIQSRVAAFPGEDSHASEYDHADRSAAQGDYHSPSDHPSINSAASLAAIMNNPESVAPSAASLASLAQSGRGQLLDEDDDDADNSDSQLHYSHDPYHSSPPPPQSHSRTNNHNRHIPQNDGAADSPLSQPHAAATNADSNAMAEWRKLRDSRRRAYKTAIASIPPAAISQLDGASDDEDDEDDEDDADPQQPTASANNSAIPDNPEVAADDLINSDLDDEDEDDEENGGDEDIEHMVLCQYDKVTRSKNKWKCVLRDGIMLVNGRDYLFQKATGDFEW
ncbi:transcription factor IIA subunit alpha [Coemansia sp. RSA 1358]|uniref:Transcription factor IIA subunit alpha n=1 Tax=Coemansia umbellata TaxID=1424467 RepID=A0ABQ8PSP7_9FUNG|nr:transcription factor IIA subunit alpha [Coemansia umbellata]KAJ2625601.1 transcription factor IIA subunit alpha [Coemansia sp. RSA 1358]